MLTMSGIKRNAPVTLRHGRNVTLERQILEDVVPQSRPLAQFLAAMWTVDSANSHEQPNWHLVRSAIVAGLNEHSQFVKDPFNPGRLGGTPLPLPLARFLVDAFAVLANGESPPVFHPTRVLSGQGNRRKHAQQNKVDTVVRFLTAVDLGWITKPGARTWVALRLGMSRRQIQRWVDESGSLQQRKRQLKLWRIETAPGISTDKIAIFLMRQVSHMKKK